MSGNSFDLTGLRERYARDGYVVVREEVDAAIIREAAAHAHRTIAAHPGKTFDQIYMLPMFVSDRSYLKPVRQPRMVDIAGAILGPDLSLFATG